MLNYCKLCGGHGVRYFDNPEPAIAKCGSCDVYPDDKTALQAVMCAFMARPRYYLLLPGDIIAHGDEVLQEGDDFSETDTQKWVPVACQRYGDPITEAHLPLRRRLEFPDE
jgi:hypothetical protein